MPLISGRAPDRRLALRRVRFALVGALGSALMLTACNTNGPYYRSAHSGGSPGSYGWNKSHQSFFSGNEVYISDDPIFAIIAIGIIAIPAIVKGIDDLAHHIW